MQTTPPSTRPPAPDDGPRTPDPFDAPGTPDAPDTLVTPDTPATTVEQRADGGEGAEGAGAGASGSSDSPGDGPSRLERWRAVWSWISPLVVLLFALTSFRSVIADWNDVPTGSMKPTILEGDRVVVNKVAYDLRFPFTTWRLAAWGGPARGDIVVLKSPENGKRLIKRVIGLPGDVIALRNHRLFVNGQPADYEPIDAAIASRLDEADRRGRQIVWEEVGQERHPVMVIPALAPIRGNYGPVVVPDEGFFLMGDNRDESRDSRAIGFVPRDLILGKAFGVAFSLDQEAFLRFRSGRWFEGLE